MKVTAVVLALVVLVGVSRPCESRALKQDNNSNNSGRSFFCALLRQQQRPVLKWHARPPVLFRSAASWATNGMANPFNCCCCCLRSAGEALATAIASADAGGGQASAAAEAFVGASAQGGGKAQAAAQALASVSKKSECVVACHRLCCWCLIRPWHWPELGGLLTQSSVVALSQSSCCNQPSVCCYLLPSKTPPYTMF
jgi:hypothetical protein